MKLILNADDIATIARLDGVEITIPETILTKIGYIEQEFGIEDDDVMTVTNKNVLLVDAKQRVITDQPRYLRYSR